MYQPKVDRSFSSREGTKSVLKFSAFTGAVDKIGVKLSVIS